MSTRSRAKPWFALAARLQRYQVRVDQLEEAGGLWSVGALLGARDFDCERVPQVDSRLVEAMVDMFQRERSRPPRPLTWLVSPAQLRWLREMMVEDNALSTLQMRPGVGGLSFMGVPVRADARVSTPVIVNTCQHPFFTYVLQRRDPPVASWRRFNDRVSLEKVDFYATKVTQCTVCGDLEVPPGTYDPRSVMGTVHKDRQRGRPEWGPF